MIDLNRRKESSIEDKFNRECRRYGGDPYKFVSPGRNGVTDRLVQWPGGVTTYAEIKTSDGILSPKQVEEIQKMKNRGMVVFVIRNEIDIAMFLSASLQKVVAV